jgi:glycosyltransferase involved in cell wall biosynthesis
MQTENSKPRVSIISPVYNAEKFIARCIDSVLAQTFTDWEQIIVDDGSSDGTESVVRRYDDPRIKYIRLPHRGLEALAESYNTALAAARGDLIAVLEGDDAWLPQKLERQVRAFDEDPLVMLTWGNGLVIDENDRVVRRWRIDRIAKRKLPLSELFRILVRWNVLTPALTVMARHDALRAVGGFSQVGSSLFVDLPTWMQISGRVDGYARFIDEDLGLYRIYSHNTGTVQNSKMRFEHQRVADHIIADLGPDNLKKLGWSKRDDRKTIASASLTRGVAYFQEHDRVRAKEAFASGLRHTRSPREYLVGSLGYVSALTGWNLIGAVQKLQRRIGSLTVRLRVAA